MNRVTIAAVVIALCTWFYLAGTVTSSFEKAVSVAEAVCDEAHTKDGSDWEQACGTALESIDATYSCDIKGVECHVTLNRIH